MVKLTLEGDPDQIGQALDWLRKMPDPIKSKPQDPPKPNLSLIAGGQQR